MTTVLRLGLRGVLHSRQWQRTISLRPARMRSTAPDAMMLSFGAPKKNVCAALGSPAGVGQGGRISPPATHCLIGLLLSLLPALYKKKDQQRIKRERPFTGSKDHVASSTRVVPESSCADAVVGDVRVGL